MRSKNAALEHATWHLAPLGRHFVVGDALEAIEIFFLFIGESATVLRNKVFVNVIEIYADGLIKTVTAFVASFLSSLPPKIPKK